MFFNAEDDDQDFLSNTGGSKLASLFGVDKASGHGGNESLTYTAPKQPKKKDPASQQTAGSLLFATAVHAYKYVDGQYASQGKLGSAILGNPATQDYRILLYVSKQQPVTNAKITSAFVFTVQSNNYASFYDDSRQTWSLMFDNEQTSTQFAKQVGLAKACSNGAALDSVVTQDIRLGDGGALENSDLVEVKYTGWLLTNGAFGQEFDSNVKADKLFRFKIGKGKVIKAWDQGVIGMKKGSKRLIIAPPNLAYGSQGIGNKVPGNSTLIFEVEVVRVKLSKSESPKPSPVPTPEPHNASPAPLSDLEMEDHTVKGRTKSISEQMSHQLDDQEVESFNKQGSGKTEKAKLLSRMAKMGKPMLPMVGAIPAQPDSDEEPVPQSPQQMTESPVNVQPVRQTVKPPVVTKPVPHHPTAMETQASMLQTGMVTNPTMQQPYVQPQPAFMPPPAPSGQLALYQNPQSLLQQQQATMLQQQLQQQQQAAFQSPTPQSGFLGSYPTPQYPGASVPPPTSQPSEMSTPMLLTETRQQNTELRLAVGKVTDKVDRIVEKLDQLHTQQSGSLALQSSTPNMEAAVLMHNIQRIVQENDRLKKDLYEKSAKVESLNDKISELLQSNQMFVEKSQTLLEQRNEGFKTTATQSQAKVLALEQDKVQLATELSMSTSQLSSLQLEIANMRKKEAELHQKLGTSSHDVKKTVEELDTLRTQHTEDEEKVKELSSSLKEEKQRRKAMETKLSQIQEEYADLRLTKETIEKNLNDRKKKAADERRKMEEEMEDTKSQLEAELQTVREKLRRQKTSTDAVTAEQVSQVEKELNAEWKSKCDKLLTAGQEKHNRALQDVKQENEDLEQEVAGLQAKIQNMKASSGSSDEKIKILQDEVDELSGWKVKYDNLRGQATSMKEKYEDQINNLEEDRDTLEEERDVLKQQVKEQEVTTTVTSGGRGGKETVVAEVKKIMNSVYQQLRAQFTADESYSGADVLGAILDAIKSTTLKLVQQQSSMTEEKDDNEEEDEEEDNDEDEEEEEEEEEESVVDETEEKEEVAPMTITDTAVKKSTLQTSSQPPQSAQVIQEPQQTVSGSEESDFDDSEPEETPLSSSRQDKQTSQHEKQSPMQEDTVPTAVPTPEDTIPTAVPTPEDTIPTAVPTPEDTIPTAVPKPEDTIPTAVPKPEDTIPTAVPTPEDTIPTAVPTPEDTIPTAVPKPEDTIPTAVPKPEDTIPTAVPTPEDTVSAALSQSNPLKEDKQSVDVLESPLDNTSNSSPENTQKEKDIVEPVVKETDSVDAKPVANHDSVETEQKLKESTGTKGGGDGILEGISSMPSRTPPPLLDDDENSDHSSDKEDRPLFGDDDTVEDTLGISFKAQDKEESKDKKLPSKKDLENDEDLKPKPPPPLFGSDDEDDDLDWLS